METVAIQTVEIEREGSTTDPEIQEVDRVIVTQAPVILVPQNLVEKAKTPSPIVECNTVKDISTETNSLNKTAPQNLALSKKQKKALRKRLNKERLEAQGISLDQQNCKMSNYAVHNNGPPCLSLQEEQQLSFLNNTTLLSVGWPKPVFDNKISTVSTVRETRPIFIVEVAPESYPAMCLDEEGKHILTRAIVRSFEHLSNGLFPTFTDINLEDGACVISCVGEMTKKWLLKKIPVLQWPGPKLKAANQGKIIKKQVVLCRAPEDLFDFNHQEILQLLLNQNPTLNCGQWKYMITKVLDHVTMHFWMVGIAVTNAIKALLQVVYLGLQTTTLSLIPDSKYESEEVHMQKNQPPPPLTEFQDPTSTVSNISHKLM